MTSHSPDWTLYRSFAAVLREGSLSAAARYLGLSQPTLGRHIASLEIALNLVLFIRSPEGLIPTQAAEALRSEAEAVTAAADALFRAASGSLTGNSGAVRIVASEVTAAEVLPPILARLQAEHPQLVIELAVSNRIDDLLRRDADIAVRMTRPSQNALLAKKVGTSELGLFAHPTYLAGRSAPTTGEDLSQHALVGFDVPATYTQILQLDGQPLTRDQFSFRTDSDTAQLAAIRAGCGIGVCHVPLAAGLVRILPALFAPRVEVWLAMHQDLRPTARCRTVFDTLTIGLRDYLGRKDGLGDSRLASIRGVDERSERSYVRKMIRIGLLHKRPIENLSRLERRTVDIPELLAVGAVGSLVRSQTG